MSDEIEASWWVTEGIALSAIVGEEGPHGEWRPQEQPTRFCREAGSQDGDPDIGQL